MSILSRLFGKKETPVVAEPQKKPRKPWKHDKCAGSGKEVLPTQEVREENGRKIKLGMCPECGRLGVPTKGNDLVAAHYPKPKEPVLPPAVGRPDWITPRGQ
tara:strand:+ start:725 stop:1030 length:306 start_codon:yes stop_codon:yes gene_type:complete